MTQAVVQVRNIVARSGFANPLTLEVLVTDEDYLKVYADTTLLDNGPDYEITGIGDPNGVSIEIIGAEDVDNYVGVISFVAVYEPPLDQQSDLSAGGVLGRNYESGLDQQNRRLQALGDRVLRSIKMPATVDGDIVLDEPVDQWGLVWDDDTQAFIWAPVNDAGSQAASLPIGGTTGQLLRKASDSDFDTEWVDGAFTADAISFTPSGGISAVTVQDALEELDTEKLSVAAAAATYLTAAVAASTYLTQASAASTYLTQANAASTYLTQASAATAYVARPSPTVDNTLARFNGTSGQIQGSGVVLDDSNNVSGVVALTASGVLTAVMPRGAFTHSDELYNATLSNVVGLTGNDIYAPIFPGVDHYDTLQGVTNIADGSTIEHATGLAGYIYNDDATTNGVSLFGAGIAARDGAAIWGLNTLLQDAATRTAGTATDRILIGGEFDFNVMNPATQVIGVSVGGNSLAQSNNAIAFIVNSLGTGYKWTTGFYSMDGAASIGLALGPTATSGTNVDSQTLLMQYFNGASAKKTLTMYAETNALVIGNDDTDFTLELSGYINIPAAKRYAVGTTAVVGPRKTGWGTATGTATRTTFATGSVTLPQLAERVKALIDDLHGTAGHGLIGT